MTPTGLQSTIAEGLQAKGKQQGLELEQSGVGFGEALAGAMAGADLPTGFRVVLYTPLTWIKQQASNAGKEYRPFSVSNVTSEMKENVVRLSVYPSMPRTVSARGTLLAKSVRHVVIRDAQRQRVVQPIRSVPFTEEAQNAFGARARYSGVSAVFSMDDVEKLRADNEEFFVTIVTDRGDTDFKIKRRHLSRLPFQRFEPTEVVLAGTAQATQRADRTQQVSELVARAQSQLAASYGAAFSPKESIPQSLENCLKALRKVDAVFKVEGSDTAIMSALVDAQIAYDEISATDKSIFEKSSEALAFALDAFKRSRNPVSDSNLAYARSALHTAAANIESLKTTGRELTTSGEPKPSQTSEGPR